MKPYACAISLSLLACGDNVNVYSDIGTVNQAAKKKPDAGTPAAVTVRSAAGQCECWSTSFTSSTYDIYFAIDDRPGQPGQLELYMPDGLPYVTHTTTTQADGRAWVRLPVAGTWITQYHMYGTWTAKAWFSDYAQTTFEIHE